MDTSSRIAEITGVGNLHAAHRSPLDRRRLLQGVLALNADVRGESPEDAVGVQRVAQELSRLIFLDTAIADTLAVIGLQLEVLIERFRPPSETKP